MTYKTRIADYTLRNAEESDVGLILWFIRSLAEYEKLTEEVIATEAGLRKYLFGKNPSAEVVIGEFRAEPVAFALYFHNFSTFMGKPGIYLEDLFVVPEMRGRGFGKALLQFLAWLAVERDCGRLEWAVLDWNEPAISFYESLGSRLMKEWIVNRLTGKALEDLAARF